MKHMSKLLALILVLALAMSMAACGGDDGKGKVYFLNFKPEQDEAYQAIAKEYTEKTGIEVKVVTAASGTYEQQLKSEIAKKDAPTIFQVNGVVGYQNWKDYCADLKGTALYSHLVKGTGVVGNDTGVYGIPFAMEGYGIIYNKAIMDKYFAMDGAKATSINDINSFDKLKEVVEDMQAKKDALGLDGVFASTSLKAGEEWRWQTHLANIALSPEFKDKNADMSDPKTVPEIDFSYSDNFKNLFDLYLNNSTVEPALTGSKTVNDAMAEFALGKCAMVQNGNWAYSQIAEVDGNVVKAEDVAFLPLYMGLPGEATQGIAIGTENFLCLNSQASEADQKASADFLEWLFTSEEGKAHVMNDLGFIAPFDTFSATDTPSDPLGKSVVEWQHKDGVVNTSWDFTIFPSQTFKDNFGAALLQYAQGSKTWDEVKAQIINDWKTEKANMG